MKLGLSYDDVLLVPGYSEVKSRSHVDLSVNLAGIKLKLPFISSPMTTVTGPIMAYSMCFNGGLGVLHRFTDIETQAKWVENLKRDGVWVGAAVGVVNDYKDRSLALASAGVDLFVVDVAHGDHSLVVNAIDYFKSSYKVPVMAGSIATPEAAERLIEAGADILRVGIGPGAACTTRILAGCGVPQFTAIKEIADVADKAGVQVCADGGINYSGDIVKALGAGADCVMCGSLFAATDQSPGEKKVIGFGENQKVVKEYAGMASQSAKIDRGSSTKHIEGISTYIKYKGPLKTILEELAEGVRSGFSYAGAKDLTEFHAKARFIQVTPTANHLRKM